MKLKTQYEKLTKELADKDKHHSQRIDELSKQHQEEIEQLLKQYEKFDPKIQQVNLYLYLCNF